jgi:hypothetical protein
MAPKGPRHACPLPPTGIGAAQDVNELVGRMSVRDFNPRTLSGPHDTLAQLRVRACLSRRRIATAIATERISTEPN